MTVTVATSGTIQSVPDRAEPAEEVLVKRLMHPGHDLGVGDPAYGRFEVAAPDESVVQAGVPADRRCGDDTAGCRDSRSFPQGCYAVPAFG